ncbi:hypothetical protein [Bradyrhizobium sp. B120]|uniref:hypothetical protein n=1 Tax=Bradyrhizobium sp. B120 TaxID=3410088 RepID=UPI003B9825A4
MGKYLLSEAVRPACAVADATTSGARIEKARRHLLIDIIGSIIFLKRIDLRF